MKKTQKSVSHSPSVLGGVKSKAKVQKTKPRKTRVPTSLSPTTLSLRSGERDGSRTFGVATAPQARLPKTGRITQGEPGTGLSKCALNYAKAMSNPFGEFDELPWVPADPAMETQKWRCLTRGSFQTGTASMGFVMYQPMNPTKDAASVVYTLPVNNVNSYSSVLGGGVLGQLRPALPHAIAAFSTNDNFLQARLVGSALRVRNYTKALNVGGILIGTRLPSGDSLNQYTMGQLFAMPQSIVTPVSLEGQGDWQTIVWVPTDITELSFPQEAVNYTIGAGGQADTFSIGFLAQAPSTVAAEAQTYEWELMEFWEFSGAYSADVLPQMTISHSDSVGIDRVLTSVAAMPGSLHTGEYVNQMADGIVEAMAHSDSTAKTVEDLLGFVGLAVGSAAKITKALSGFLLI